MTGGRVLRSFSLLAALVVMTSAVLLGVPRVPAQAASAGSVVSLINGARSSAGVGSLRANGSLAAVAQRWASHMASTGTLSHNPSTPAQIPGGWRSWGENVGESSTSSASALHAMFMASGPHRSNILKAAFTDVGVGVATSHGLTYICEVFAQYARTTSSGSGAGSSGGGSPSGSGTTAAPSKTAQHPSAPTATKPVPTPAHDAKPSSSAPTTAAQAAGTPARPATSTVAPSATASLRVGSVGPAVATAQRELRARGFAVAVDGRFGLETDHAVRAFQTASGLAPDGVIGPRTRDALAVPARAPRAADRTATTTPATAGRSSARPSSHATPAPEARATAGGAARDAQRAPLSGTITGTITATADVVAAPDAAATHEPDHTPRAWPAVGGTLFALVLLGAGGWALHRRRTSGRSHATE